MFLIHRKPPAFLLAHQPAWFEVMYENPNNPEGRLFAEVSRGGEILGIDYGFATQNKKALFELSEFFAHSLKPVFSPYNQVGTPLFLDTNTQSAPWAAFTIRFFDDLGGSVQTTVWAVKGEITPDTFPQARYGLGYASVTDMLSSRGPVLSFRPRDIFLRYKQQPERLYVAIHNPGLTSPISCIRKIIFSDGAFTQNTYATIEGSLGEVYELKTSYEDVVGVMDNPDNPVAMYQVSLNQGGQELCAPYTYHVAFMPRADSSIVFLNCLGGFDCFCPSGKLSLSYGSKNILDHMPPSPGILRENYQLSGRNLEHLHTINTGFVDEKTMEWLAQLVYSQKAFWVDNQGVLPIVFQSNSLRIQRDSRELLNANIDFMFNTMAIAERYEP